MAEVKKPSGSPSIVNTLVWTNVTEFYNLSTQSYFTTATVESQVLTGPQQIVPGAQKLQKGDQTFPQVAPLVLDYGTVTNPNGSTWTGWLGLDHWDVREIVTDKLLAQGYTEIAPSVPITANGVRTTA